MKTQRRIISGALLMIVCAMLLSCNSSSPKKREGINYNINGVPDIASFSQTMYENYERHFSRIDYAMYYHGYTVEKVLSDDPRLIQLLNFIAFSEENDYSTWRQSYVDEKEVESYLSSNEAMLEIYFHGSESATLCNLKNTKRIIICADSYLIFVNNNSFDDSVEGTNCAERYWPYGGLVIDEIIQGRMDENMLSYEGWGGDRWIDLLVYTGFTAE